MAYDPIINFYDEPGGPNGGYKNGGSGGGGAVLGTLVEVSIEVEGVTLNVATTAFDISGDTFPEVRDAINEHANVCHIESSELYASVPSGCYAAINCNVPSDWSTEDVQVLVGETATSDFECRKLYDGYSLYSVVLTMQIPAEEVSVNFGIE